ncbi:MAG TPA: MAPEG family protein [Spongiibacteraceae bacterium]|nr:MAPEG family protein [Spongiibacteraceae bacterium]
MLLVEIVIALALLQLVYFAMRVGAARGKYNVPAPATSGHEIFERYYRVQMNTVELIVLLVPALVIFAEQISAKWAAGLGAVYLIGRFLYLQGYVADPKKRSLGFGLSFVPILVLLIGGLGGALYRYFLY